VDAGWIATRGRAKGANGRKVVSSKRALGVGETAHTMLTLISMRRRVVTAWVPGRVKWFCSVPQPCEFSEQGMPRKNKDSGKLNLQARVDSSRYHLSLRSKAHMRVTKLLNARSSIEVGTRCGRSSRFWRKPSACAASSEMVFRTI
jgi:hypothetical protein